MSEISCEELAELLARPAAARPVLIDVRNPDEHDYCALPGSILMPLPELPEHDDEIDALRGKQVVVYCHHGVRSLSGAAYFESRGVDAKSLRGGIDRWSLAVDPRLPRY